MPAFDLGNLRSTPIGDVLSYLARMPLQEAAAMLEELYRETGIRIPFAMTLAEKVDGTDYAGQPITGNPVLVGARDQNTSVLRAMASAGDGSLLVRGALTDVGGYIVPSADRAGILAVGPPVWKLWTAEASLSGAGNPIATQAAPGAGLRNIVLAFMISIAVSTAKGVTQALLQSPIGGLNLSRVSVAVPTADCRLLQVNGPFICPVNTAVSLQGVTQGAGDLGSVSMVGYVAAFP